LLTKDFFKSIQEFHQTLSTLHRNRWRPPCLLWIQMKISLDGNLNPNLEQNRLHYGSMFVFRLYGVF